jgi:cysteine sulfinate desulfinase/cysteine desulfurase-like protein
VSHVLKALYGENAEILKWGSVRFSLGRQTTKEDLDTVIEKLKGILSLLTKSI